MRVNMILASSEDGVIGVDGGLPWNQPADMAHFRATTMGHPVITGRVNYESIPEKYRPLKGRTNIVVTRNVGYSAPGAIVATSLEDAIAAAKATGATECFIIGGGQIYKEAMDKGLVDRAIITVVHTTVIPEGKESEMAPRVTLIPTVWKTDGWRCSRDPKEMPADEKNPHAMTFMDLVQGHPRVYGARDLESERDHLRELPLKEGWVRMYEDHTGRWFKDFSPETWAEMTKPNPVWGALNSALTDEINKKIVAKIKAMHK